MTYGLSRILKELVARPYRCLGRARTANTFTSGTRIAPKAKGEPPRARRLFLDRPFPPVASLFQRSTTMGGKDGIRRSHVGRPISVGGGRIPQLYVWISGLLGRCWRGLAQHRWAVSRVGSAGEVNDGPANVGTRLLLAAIFFAAAFAIDLRTDRQFSPVLGSAAIYGSALALFPTIRSGLIAATAHGAIWVGFNIVRAVADDAGLGIVDVRAVSDIERWLFGGRLPASMLQNHFLDPNLIQPRDVALGLVHASFFVVPHGIALLTWFRRRDVFVSYQMATASCFAPSLAAFILLPAAPPWTSDPDRVTRVTHRIVTHAIAGRGSGRSAGPGEAFWFEPNAVAAMPSVHVAAAVLVFLALGSLSRRGWGVGVLYALAMSVAVVYLGEHFVLDVVAGWLVALVAWRLVRARGLASF